MQALERLQETLNSGDPECRKWFLVRNNYLPFVLCFGYVLMSVVGPNLMKDMKPFRIRKIMIVFNFGMVLGYLSALILAAIYLPKIRWEEFCIRGEVRKGHPSYLLSSAAWGIYMMKYLQFFDTLFFILRKKNNLVSFLHVFHHFIVPIVGWTLFRVERTGVQAVPLLLNSFVHVIMYTYYGLAAMGPNVRKYLWWKKYLTQLQIVQFVLIILFVTVIVPKLGCTLVSVSYLIDLICAALFLFLFYRFYTTSFKPTLKKID